MNTTRPDYKELLDALRSAPPAYEELLEALRSAPPAYAIADDRYVAWRLRVEDLLRRCEA